MPMFTSRTLDLLSFEPDISLIDRIQAVCADINLSFYNSFYVDLLVMNDASPVINFEVIRPNVPLFVRNEDLKLDVEQYVMSRYLDRKYHEDFLNRELLKRIREKRDIQDVSSRLPFTLQNTQRSLQSKIRY